MSTMHASDTLFTSDDYLRLPEGFPAELIRGQLVKSPSPVWGHQVVAGRIYSILVPLVGVRRVVPAPIDVFLDRENVLQPDVLVVRHPLGARRRRARDPQLVVEVLSPRTEKRDREEKSGIYLDHGLDEVWLVDLRRGTIGIRRPDGDETFRGTAVAASRSVEGFRLVPADVLAD